MDMHDRAALAHGTLTALTTGAGSRRSSASRLVSAETLRLSEPVQASSRVRPTDFALLYARFLR